MSTVKKQLQEVIASLPDDCTREDFRWQLYLHRKMEDCGRDIAEGRVHLHDEAVDLVKSWRESSGQTRP